MNVLDRLSEALELIRRNRRVLLVHPGDYGPVTARIYADGMSGQVRVEQSEHVKPGQVILINPDIELPIEPEPARPLPCNCGQQNPTHYWVCPVHGIQIRINPPYAEPYSPGRITCSTVA